jgi:hypothetical protein
MTQICVTGLQCVKQYFINDHTQAICVIILGSTSFKLNDKVITYIYACNFNLAKSLLKLLSRSKDDFRVLLIIA